MRPRVTLCAVAGLHACIASLNVASSDTVAEISDKIVPLIGPFAGLCGWAGFALYLLDAGVDRRLSEVDGASHAAIVEVGEALGCQLSRARLSGAAGQAIRTDQISICHAPEHIIALGYGCSIATICEGSAGVGAHPHASVEHDRLVAVLRRLATTHRQCQSRYCKALQSLIVHNRFSQ